LNINALDDVATSKRLIAHDLIIDEHLLDRRAGRQSAWRASSWPIIAISKTSAITAPAFSDEVSCGIEAWVQRT